MKKGVFVVVEGMDGTGKTTVSKRLAERLPAFYYCTPPEEFSVMRKWVDREVTIEARYVFYLTALVLAGKEIKELLKSVSVVCDRYVLSTTAYHLALGLPSKYLEAVSTIDLPRPTITFYLHCEENERLKRIGQRGASAMDLEHTRIASKIGHEFEKADATRIDTTYKDVDKVVDEILEHILRFIEPTTGDKE